MFFKTTQNNNQSVTCIIILNNHYAYVKMIARIYSTVIKDIAFRFFSVFLLILLFTIFAVLALLYILLTKFLLWYIFDHRRNCFLLPTFYSAFSFSTFNRHLFLNNYNKFFTENISSQIKPK